MMRLPQEIHGSSKPLYKKNDTRTVAATTQKKYRTLEISPLGNRALTPNREKDSNTAKWVRYMLKLIFPSIAVTEFTSTRTGRYARASAKTAKNPPSRIGFLTTFIAMEVGSIISKTKSTESTPAK